MQLINLTLYHESGDTRAIDFAPGRLNIVTGISKTGKSALQPIVEYCLGRTTDEIPAGVTDFVSWFGLTVRIGETNLFCGRPVSETSTNSTGMLVVGTDRPPSFEELIVNTNTDAIRAELTARIGIEDRKFLPGPGSMRSAYQMSIGQALFYSFQDQGEIANKWFVFHRQNDDQVARTIGETLPYFLGAAGPDRAALQFQLTETEREIRRLQKSIREARASEESANARLAGLRTLAVETLLLESSDGNSELELFDELRSALSITAPVRPQFEPKTNLERRDRLELDRRRLRTELEAIEEKIGLLRQLDLEGGSFENELVEQHSRLTSLGLNDPSANGTAAGHSCPVCGQGLIEPDPVPQQLTELAQKISTRLSNVRGVVPKRKSELARLEASAESIREKLREVAEGIGQLALADHRIASERELAGRQAFVQGRIAAELERTVRPANSSSGQDEKQLRIVEQRASELREELGEDDHDEVRSRLDLVANDMTKWSQRLRLEYSENRVRLNIEKLQVVATIGDGRPRPMFKIGSAENHIGYHLATHLALHRFFISNNRPTPRFLMLDQPSQAWFPEGSVDGMEAKDVDLMAVGAQFELLRDVVDELDQQFQVVVTDHANLKEDWFQESVIENWRNGDALLPESWRTPDITA